MFTTKITSQGTISLPAALRKKYGLVAGETVTVEDRGEIVISKTPDFAELRAKNAKYVKKLKPSTDQVAKGWTKHVTDAYGQ